MTTTAQRTGTRGAPTDPSRTNEHHTGRNNARAGGIFYLLTFAASLPAFVLLNPILKDPGFITGASHHTQVTLACLFDFITAVAGIGSAVAVFPIARRANESLALGFVMSRMLEAAVIMIGVLALLTVVVLRQDLAGTATDPAALTTTGLIGAPLLLTANMFTLFGHNTQTGAWTMLATLPVAAWELSVGFYMTFMGFKRNRVTEATA